MTINDIARYQYNAITNRYAYAPAVITSRQHTQKVSTACCCQSGPTTSDSLQFLNQYKSKMDGLKSAADKIRMLSGDNVWENLNVSSSDETIVSNATAYGKIPQRAQYDIDVRQLARRQISQIAVGDIDFSQNSSFEIQFTGGDGNAVTAVIQIDTASGSQTDILNNLTDQINHYESQGIRASLVENEAGIVSSIQLEGEEPGSGKGFRITGINYTNTQKAQDLAYTVNGTAYTSSSNHNIQLDPSGDNRYLRVDFNNVGKAVIRADVDTKKLSGYTEKFVDAYNQAIDFLVDNAHRGSAVSNALGRFKQPPLYPDIMEKIGFHFGEDGKIAFQADEFQKAMKEDTRQVYDILADNYSIADIIYQKANTASNASSGTLLDKSQVHDHCCGITITNNYYIAAPYPYYPSFLYSGPLFFNTKI